MVVFSLDLCALNSSIHVSLSLSVCRLNVSKLRRRQSKFIQMFYIISFFILFWYRCVYLSIYCCPQKQCVSIKRMRSLWMTVTLAFGFFLLFCSFTHHQRRRSKTQTESNHTQWLSKFFQVDVQFHDDKRTNKSKTFNVIHIWHESLSPTIAKKLITSNFTPDILTSQYETHKKAFFSSRQNNLIYTCKSIYGHFGYWCGWNWMWNFICKSFFPSSSVCFTRQMMNMWKNSNAQTHNSDEAKESERKMHRNNLTQQNQNKTKPHQLIVDSLSSSSSSLLSFLWYFFLLFWGGRHIWLYFSRATQT